ncbi:MAG: hypothetical protein CUR33_07390 [Pseudomonas sp.]|nr:MAG: hypothetical protein CUR33_07390 [Pseudomonas sp.] [Pseudomonas sp. FEMGT703P]
MMGADSLHVAASFGMSSCVPQLCRRACSLSEFALCFAHPPGQEADVHASCLERAWSAAVIAFASGLAGSSTASPGRWSLGHTRQAKAEGKTKGGGTWTPVTPVCTRERSGTALPVHRAVYGVLCAPMPVCLCASYATPRRALTCRGHSYDRSP